MGLTILDKYDTSFPPVNHAELDGLLAIGGDISTDRLLNAYRSGIFPWYDEGPILWWCPDPRFVLFPQELNISKSMRPLLKGNKFRFSINTAFRKVVENCGQISRTDQQGTWINEDIIHAYSKLHELGYAHCAEAWEKDELVGGLYGVRLGKIFFGESMFSKTSNASKFAFIRYVQQLQSEGVVLIDCQVYTDHLKSLGARMIPRSEFIKTIGG